MMNNINMTYEITLKCYSITSMNQLQDIEYLRNSNIEEITLTLDKYSASNFLYRFTNNTFEVNKKYKVSLRYNNDHKFIGIFIKDTSLEVNNIFVVINFLEVLQTINEGYIRIRTLEKIESLLRFDFESSYKESNSGVVDEFDVDPKYGVSKLDYDNNERDCSNYEEEIICDEESKLYNN